MHFLIVLTTSENQLTIKIVTFDKIIMVANKKEKGIIIIKNLLSKIVDFVSNITKFIDDEITVIILYCIHYKTNHYTLNNC